MTTVEHRLRSILFRYGVTKVGKWYPQGRSGRHVQTSAQPRVGIMTEARYGVLPVYVFWCVTGKHNSAGVYVTRDGGDPLMSLDSTDGGRWSMITHLEQLLK